MRPQDDGGDPGINLPFCSRSPFANPLWDSVGYTTVVELFLSSTHHSELI